MEVTEEQRQILLRLFVQMSVGELITFGFTAGEIAELVEFFKQLKGGNR